MELAAAEEIYTVDTPVNVPVDKGTIVTKGDHFLAARRRATGAEDKYNLSQ